jgi:DNA polymerase-4
MPPEPGSPPGKIPPASLFAAVTVPHFIPQALAVARPEWRGKPFAVVEQDPESHKTLVTEVSDAAQAWGVHPGLPVFLLRRKWHGVAVIPRDPAAEARLRERMRALWLRCTPEFTVRESGGAMLDMTGTPAARKYAPEAWAAHLRSALLNLGLESVTIAVASSQVVARVLSRELSRVLSGIPARTRRGGEDLLAPATRVCPPGEEARALGMLSPSLLPGLSSAARARLRKYGLETIATVRRLGREELTLRFGTEGEKLYTLAQGMDLEPVVSRRKPLAVETVLPQDLNDEAALRNQVRLTADKLAHALRRAGMKTSRFTLVLAYSDGRSARRTQKVHPPTAAFAPLAEAAASAFFELYQRRVALRRLRLLVAAPATETGQRELFEETGHDKKEALEAAIDRIRAKREFGAVLSGSNVAASPPQTNPRTRARLARRVSAKASPPSPPPPLSEWFEGSESSESSEWSEWSEP